VIIFSKRHKDIIRPERDCLDPQSFSLGTGFRASVAELSGELSAA
jgi:hypothetical protein